MNRFEYFVEVLRIVKSIEASGEVSLTYFNETSTRSAFALIRITQTGLGCLYLELSGAHTVYTIRVLRYAGIKCDYRINIEDLPKHLVGQLVRTAGSSFYFDETITAVSEMFNVVHASFAKHRAKYNFEVDDFLSSGFINTAHQLTGMPRGLLGHDTPGVTTIPKGDFVYFTAFSITVYCQDFQGRHVCANFLLRINRDGTLSSYRFINSGAVKEDGHFKNTFSFPIDTKGLSNALSTLSNFVDAYVGRDLGYPYVGE